MKYQLDEFKKEMKDELNMLKSTIESKHKEMDSYVLGFSNDLQSIIEAKKRERADSILEMTSIFKKVDEVVQFRTEITKTLFSIATMMACVVEKEALTMAFEVEKEKKLNALLIELKSLAELSSHSVNQNFFFAQRRGLAKVVVNNGPTINLSKRG
jgi:hypothetical protein